MAVFIRYLVAIMVLMLATNLLLPGSADFGIALADSDDDNDSIHSAVRRNEALPYWKIRSRIERHYNSKVIGVKVFRERRRWIYELKLISNSGNLYEVHVDAKSARVIKIENEQ